MSALGQSASGAVARAVASVAALNICYFAFELTVAQRIDSVSLFADSIDFLEDAAFNGLILLALPGRRVRSHRFRATTGMTQARLLYGERQRHGLSA
jgi:Co/Zn/Cd efflux system component